MIKADKIFAPGYITHMLIFIKAITTYYGLEMRQWRHTNACLHRPIFYLC